MKGAFETSTPQIWAIATARIAPLLLLSFSLSRKKGADISVGLAFLASPSQEALSFTVHSPFFSVSLNTEGSHLTQVFCTCCFSFLNVPPFHLAYSYSAFKSQLNYHFFIVAFPRSLPPTRLGS